MSERPMLPIPIEAAEQTAKTYGYDRVVIIARRVGEPPASCGEEPACVESGWCAESHYVSANALASYVPGTCDWQDSLVKRPN